MEGIHKSTIEWHVREMVVRVWEVCVPTFAPQALCEVETENQLNPTHFRGEPASCNFAFVVDIF